MTHETSSLPSPALTNPDMILPYHTHTHHSTPSPPPDARQDLFPRHGMNGAPPSGDDGENGYFDGMSSKVSMARDERPVEAFRPPLPGAWQTEEDVHTLYTRPRSQSPFESLSRLRGEDAVKISDEAPNGSHEKLDRRALGADAFGDGKSMHQDNALALPMGQDFHKSVGPQSEVDDVYVVLNDDEADPTSHAALSSRAEQILANAKKRLLVGFHQQMARYQGDMGADRSSRRWRTTSAVHAILSRIHIPRQ